jgi:hypothetical protein
MENQMSAYREVEIPEIPEECSFKNSAYSRDKRNKTVLLLVSRLRLTIPEISLLDFTFENFYLSGQRDQANKAAIKKE